MVFVTVLPKQSSLMPFLSEMNPQESSICAVLKSPTKEVRVEL